MLFICAKCGCVDDTATSSYRALTNRRIVEKAIWDEGLEAYKGRMLCSECACVVYNEDGSARVIPGKWHSKFPKNQATEEQRKRVGRNGIIP